MKLCLFSQEEEINHVQNALWLQEPVQECCRLSKIKFRKSGKGLTPVHKRKGVKHESKEVNSYFHCHLWHRIVYGVR